MITQHLLLVDEDPAMHASLHRLLRRPGREFHFASSGAEALKRLAERPFSVVISDLSLPDTDGLALLKRMQSDFPACIRLVLGAQILQDLLESLLSSELAAEILQKPWNDEILENAVASALQLAADQDDGLEGIKPHLNAFAGIPPLPAIYHELNALLQDSDHVSVDKIAAVIVRDSAILTRLLHWANAAIFGQSKKVETPQRAVVVLGTTLVEALVLAQGAFSLLAPPALPGFKPETLQHHSLICGHTARLLLRDRGASSQESDRAFTAGLLHDIGKLAALSCLHAPFGQALAQARQEKDLLRNAEKQILGTCHAHIGAHLAALWNLPTYLLDAIRWHHAPHKAGPSRPIVEAVHVADALVQRHNQQNASGNYRSPQVSPRVWRATGLDRKSVEDLAQRVSQALT